MISKEKRKKLHQMLDLVIDINNAKANAFFDFSGHVDGVQVEVHKNGWASSISPDLGKMIFLGGEGKLNECNALIRKLKTMKGELKENV